MILGYFKTDQGFNSLALKFTVFYTLTDGLGDFGSKLENEKGSLVVKNVMTKCS